MNTSKLYQLIVSPQYRIWRHLLLILALGIIPFNQTFINYQDCNTLLGNKIYLICLLSFSTYVVAIYINYIVFVRKFLLKEKYLKYIICLIVLVFSLLFANIFLEYIIRTYLDLPHRIESYLNPLILLDSLASSMITIICFGCMSVTTLLRKWSDKNRSVSELEYTFLQSEINKLKGQISPSFLSLALEKASSLTKSDTQRASNILMQLGQLLRYQLYDCQRDQVLLTSEINFILNFLATRNLAKDDEITYSIDIKENVNNIFVAPLLLIILVQHISMNDKTDYLKLIIDVFDNRVLFEYIFNEDCIIAEKTIYEIKEKLEIIYPNLYVLDSERGKIKLQLNIL